MVMSKTGDNEVSTLKDLERLVKTEGKLIALFYASWCPFCSAFLPVFRAEAEKAPAFFCMVRDNGEALSDAFAIQIFPTVLFFDKGELVRRLDGKRGAGLRKEAFMDFAASCLSGSP